MFNKKTLFINGVALKFRKKNPERNFRLVSDYSKPHLSEKIIRILISYVGCINRVV